MNVERIRAWLASATQGRSSRLCKTLGLVGLVAGTPVFVEGPSPPHARHLAACTLLHESWFSRRCLHVGGLRAVCMCGMPRC